MDRPLLARSYFLLGPALHGPHARAAACVQPQSGLVLDICTGTGLLARRIARERPGLRVIGVDLDRAMIDEARRRNVDTGNGNCTFEVADATALPLPDASADAVTCALGLHEMPDSNVPRALAEAFRVLRPGGQLLVLDFNRHPRRPGARLGLGFLRRIEEHMPGFLALDLCHELYACGVRAITDRVPPDGLFVLLDGLRPGAQESRPG